VSSIEDELAARHGKGKARSKKNDGAFFFWEDPAKKENQSNPTTSKGPRTGANSRGGRGAQIGGRCETPEVLFAFDGAAERGGGGGGGVRQPEPLGTHQQNGG